jgi:MazG family protein
MSTSQLDRWGKVGTIWEIIAKLRSDGGCPWDRKQTPESVQTYLIEEAHEAAAAVRSGTAADVAEELGDLVFMVLFMIYLYEEQGAFQLEEVCEKISNKMMYRHPHVFGDETVTSTQEVKENWERLKAREQAASGKPPGSIPASLPALMRAYRMLSRNSTRESGPGNDVHQLTAEFAHSSQALTQTLLDAQAISSDEFGKIILTLVNLARLQGFQAELCLHQVLDRLSVP